jgi:hypothetical protein
MAALYWPLHAYRDVAAAITEKKFSPALPVVGAVGLTYYIYGNPFEVEDTMTLVQSYAVAGATLVALKGTVVGGDSVTQ